MSAVQKGAVREPLQWAWWPEAREQLERGCARSTDTKIVDVEAALSDGTATLWVVVEDGVQSALVTRLEHDKNGPQCFLWVMGGRDKDAFLPVLSMVEDWARAHGCKSIEGLMRPGWERVLAGYRKTVVCMRKELA